MVYSNPPTETPPTQYIFPTDRQLILALIAAVASHPWVVNSSVFYPRLVSDVEAGRPSQRVTITNYRDVGGTELIEDGLTLAVYPFHSSFSNLKGGLSSDTRAKTMNFEAYTLGGTDNSSYSELSRFRVVLQLFYQDPTFNEPIDIEYDLMSPMFTSRRYSHSKYVRLIDNRDPSLPPAAQPEYPEFNNAERKSLRIRTFPGEQILRDWMPILRAVVRDFRTLQPYAVRKPTILYVDYPSSNWLNNSEHLIFHTAYMLLEYSLFEPPGANDYLFPNPDLNITATEAQLGFPLHPVP